MSEYITPGDWMQALRTMRFGTRRGVRAATIRDVAAMLASFAEYSDGTRIRPGIARLAVYSEVDYRTARTVVAILRDDLGLILKTRAGRSRGDADTYRLAMPEDIVDRIEVRSPAQIDLEVERIRSTERRVKRPVQVSPDPVPPVDNQSRRTDVQVSPTPVDDPVQVPPDPVRQEVGPGRTGVAGTARAPRTGVAGTAVQVSLCPPTESRPRHNYDRNNTGDGVCTAVTVSRESGPDQDQICSDVGDGPVPVDDLPGAPEAPAPAPVDAAGHCTTHPGMRGGWMPDGSLRCTFCRRDARLAAALPAPTAEVTPLRPVPVQPIPPHTGGQGAVVVPFRPRSRTA